MDKLLVNRYKIVSALGFGGFGETLLAHDTQMPSQRLVVVKRLKPNNQNAHTSLQLIKQLFQKEAVVLEELGNHCGQIPQLYSYFTDGGEFYLVQEYIEGKNMAQFGQITSEHATIILSSLLNTLKYIHSKNIIHRDIKPENIILRDSDRLPVLIDFGAVKETMGAVTLGSGSTVSSVIVGTRGFMAPEQSAGRTMFSSDLYALGMTIISGMTGKLPIEMSMNPLTGELDWQSYVAKLEPKLAEVLDRSIKVDLGSRYPTAEAMYQDLHHSKQSVRSTLPSQANTFVISPKFDGNRQYSSDLQTLVNTKVANSQVAADQIKNFSQLSLKPIIVTLLLITLGLVSGLFITQEIMKTQQKAAQAEQETREAEQKRLEAEKKAVQQEQQRLATVARQAREERQRLAAERKRIKSLASSDVGISNTINSEAVQGNSSSSTTWQSTCGHSYIPGAQWWAVKGPSNALSAVKNNYCGDAFITKKETQAASFTSESAAWSFANRLSQESGFQFWVTKSSQSR
ncbi:protein kinase domain-containing protein [Umezakia ovalisporum]|uniref:protein kinase domain-containing protein n=1 Tax=Umezakia ovalisporum TaxID=75695 RepID=UPI002476052D|nr:protein kinase [Umezakia ovalisporum]MDH6081353.1 protein kinase [Umezakia ovalisporum FSS-44]MDH6094875.1 protein kinase [Umezakia ovalisporum CobakiLakeB]